MEPKIDQATRAAKFIAGKSAHQLLALIASGELPEGLTPADIGKADIARVEAKTERRAERAA